MSGAAGPRVLLLPLEFPKWESARHMSYAAQLGLEEGLAAHGAQVLTLPTPWFARAPEVCAGQRFDQAWFEVSRHEELPSGFLDWLAEQAPVRVGFLVESLEYSAGEQALSPILARFRQRAEQRMEYLTHVVPVDEADAAAVQARGALRALWWPQAVPARCINEDPPPPRVPRAVFSGSPYGERGVWLDRPDLERLLVRQPSPEKGTAYPFLFDALHTVTARQLARKGARLDSLLPRYLRSLRWLRNRSFQRWLSSMEEGCAVVNLPAHVKAYAGRVVEAMAAGRPVLSWAIPERPRTAALFRDGEEILLFPRSQPAVLAAHIERLLAEPEYAAGLVRAARRKVREFHTMERRVGQILRWIETGEEPVYQ